MSKQPESRLQKKIQRELRREFPDSWWYKVWGGPFTPAGIPDLVGTVEGLFFAFEVKRDVRSSKTSKVQDVTIAKISWNAGGTATVVRSSEEAINVVYTALASAARGTRVRRWARYHRPPV